MPCSPREPRSKRSHALQIFYYESVAAGWPEIVLCRLAGETSTDQFLQVAIFCETHDEIEDVAKALLCRLARESPIDAMAEQVGKLCAGPSSLSEEGVAIYAPTVLGAPWLHVEAVEDPERPVLVRGRYDWRPFVGLYEADAYLRARFRALSMPRLDTAGYRPRSMMLPTLPPFMPGPWE